jgi:hypothetical protein
METATAALRNAPAAFKVDEGKGHVAGGSGRGDIYFACGLRHHHFMTAISGAIVAAGHGEKRRRAL